jgi:hypothetical protein
MKIKTIQTDSARQIIQAANRQTLRWIIKRAYTARVINGEQRRQLHAKPHRLIECSEIVKWFAAL